MKRKVCVVTGTRAEYGLMYSLLKALDLHPEVSLEIVATAAHLSPEFGMTIDEIERDGFDASQRIETLLSADTPTSIGKSTGLMLISFSEALSRIKPDVLVLLGDRQYGS